MRTLTLEEICYLVTDGTHDTPKRQSEGIPLIKAKEIVGGHIDFDNCDLISYEDHLRVIARSKPEKEDTLFAHIGASLGETAFIKTSREFSIKNVALFKPNPDIVNKRYFYYYVVSPNFQSLIKNIRTGTAQPFVGLNLLRSFKVQIHSKIQVQDKIAYILSAYDDLIENNLKRIKVLEEMAQMIYREWFVNFRFPGHESVKMVDSSLGKIPEGWEVKEMADVAEVIDCLHSKKPKEAVDKKNKFGILLHIWNIVGGGKLDLSRRYYISESDYKEWTKRIEVQEGDCVITNVGRIGDFAQIPFDVGAAIGRNMTAVRVRKNTITPTYLIEYLRSPHMDRERKIKKDSGTIMDSLNVKGIIKLNVPIPPSEMIKGFDNYVRPIRHKSEIMQRQNANLRKTRDLLLPKLISGELDVENLDVRVQEEVS